MSLKIKLIAFCAAAALILGVASGSITTTRITNIIEECTAFNGFVIFQEDAEFQDVVEVQGTLTCSGTQTLAGILTYTPAYKDTSDAGTTTDTVAVTGVLPTDCAFAFFTDTSLAITRIECDSGKVIVHHGSIGVAKEYQSLVIRP